jgi:DNA-binding response OmpR family regulator
MVTVMATANGWKVLVVDDDANIRATVRMCLEAEGYAVDQAADGGGALGRVRRDPPDLILLDLSMPRMDGMALLQRLGQQFPRLPSRVIVMTANGSVRAAVQSTRLGASDFLEKPFTPDDLRLSVASVLGEARAGAGLTAGATYDAVLAGVREALADGRVDAAEALLSTAGAMVDADPTYLNLAGVVHEAHGRASSARRFYRKAVATPGGYAPAQANLDRMDEADRTGRTDAPADLGQSLAGHQTLKEP